MLLASATVAGAAPGVRAQVDRSTVAPGESFTLSIIFEGVQASGAPTLPPIPSVTSAGVSQRSEFVIENNQASQKQVFEYQLVPTQAGDITIPTIAVQAGGRIYQTSPIAVKVIAGGAAAPNAQSAATNLAMLRLVVPKSEVYVGEAFSAEIHLYLQHAQDLRMPQLNAAGFSTTPLGEPQRTSTILGGVQYNVMIFRTAVTPARTGNLTLGPVECQLTVLVPLQNQRPRGIFDQFFGPSMQARPTALRSDEHAIRVLPLPTENVPESFNGAVGSYTLTVSAGPTNLAVGDPITVRVRLQGRGLLDALSLPPQPQWRDFTGYPPTSKSEPTDPLGLSGAKNFEQVLVPQNHEIHALPPLKFSYFDPTGKTYRTLSGPAIPLTIRPSISAAAPPMITNTAQANAPPPVDDIIHIRARWEPLAMVQPPLVRQPWFLSLQAAPVIAWLGLFLARKRREKLANNPRLRRQRETAARVREGMRELPRLAAARKSDEFFAEVFRLLQEQLGARLDAPASGITEAVIEERLRDRSLSETTLNELRALFQACNQARYAPQRSSEELSSYIPRVEKTLRDLEKL